MLVKVVDKGTEKFLLKKMLPANKTVKYFYTNPIVEG